MTFNEYLSDVGSVVTIAYFVGLMIGKERNRHIFEAVTSIGHGSPISPLSTGRQTAVFLDHTIFSMFRNRPLSFRSVIISVTLSLAVLVFVILYCDIVDVKAFYYQNWALVSGVSYVGLAHSFLYPWRVGGVSDVVWDLTAAIVLCVADYLSFLQTYLLLKLAKDTSSLRNMIFIAWVDLSMTFFSSGFIVSLIIAVSILKIQTQNLQYITILTPSVNIRGTQVQAAMSRIISDSLSFFGVNTEKFAGSFIPSTIATSVIVPSGTYDDSTIAKLVSVFRNPKLGGLLINPDMTAWFDKQQDAYGLGNTKLFQGEGICRATPDFNEFDGKDFYLSPAGSGMIPLIISGTTSFSTISPALTNPVIANAIFGKVIDGRVLDLPNDTVAVVEHIQPWQHITLARMAYMVQADYSLGFERFQQFQSNLPNVDLQIYPLIQGSYCDFRDLAPHYLGKRKKFVGTSGAEVAANSTDLEIAFLFPSLIGEDITMKDESESVTVCQATTTGTGSSVTEKPNPPGTIVASYAPKICNGSSYLIVPRSATQEFDPISRIAAAQFAALKVTHISIFPLVIGSIGLTVVFYITFFCFLLTKFVVHVVSGFAPSVARFLDHESFRDNAFCAAIVFPSFLFLTAIFLLI